MNKDYYSLQIRYIVSSFFRQSISFWLLLLYLVFEYLRPQAMYPSINVIPWTMGILMLLSLMIVYEGKLFSVNNKANKYINIYLFIVFISSVMALSSEISLANIKIIIILYTVYYLIIFTLDNEEKYYLFILFYLLINFKLSLFTSKMWVMRGFTYDKYGVMAGLAWLQNSGEFAIEMCIVFSISIYVIFSLWKHLSLLKKICMLLLPLTCLGSVIASGSRGGLLGIASMLLVMSFWSKKKIIGVIIFLIMVFSAPFILTERDFERFQHIGTSIDKTGSNRIERWLKGIEMLKEYPILGVGFENWAIADKRIFNGNGAECHNIFIQCMSELGVVGLLAFLMLIYSTFQNNKITRMLACHDNNRFIFNMAKALDVSLVSYLVTGFFVTVLYYPFFWINLGMTVALNRIASAKYINESSI